MEEKKKKLQVIKIGVLVTSIFIIFMSVTYAFINITLTGTRNQIITAGNLDLELDEDENNLTITDALPMYDEVGMIQDPFTFRIINNTSTDTNYVLTIQEIDTSNLSPSDVRYGFTKDGETTIGYVSDITDGILDEGTIAGSTDSQTSTIEYSLRLWIRYDLENITEIQTKTLNLRLNLETSQNVNEEVTSGGVQWGKMYYNAEYEYGYIMYEDGSAKTYLAGALEETAEPGSVRYETNADGTVALYETGGGNYMGYVTAVGNQFILHDGTILDLQS